MFSKFVESAADQTVKFLQPHDMRELNSIRMLIMQDILEKGWKYYAGELNGIKQKIESMISTDSHLLNDYYWDANFGECWWKKPTSTSPGLRTMLEEGAGGVSKLSALATSSKTNTLLRMAGVVATNDAMTNFINKVMGEKSWMTPQQQLVFKSCFGQYFSNHEKLVPIAINVDRTYRMQKNPTAQKKDGEIQGTLMKVAGALVNSSIAGSGPFCLKFLQQVSNTLSDTNPASDVLKSVFDNVPPLTTAEVVFIKEKSTQLPPVLRNNFKPDKRLGSGSVAQAHWTMDDAGGQMVVKIMKPMYVYYFLCECDFMLTTVWREMRKNSGGNDVLLKQARQLLLFLTGRFIVEFDVVQESYNTTAGRAVYTVPKWGIQCVQMLSTITDPFPLLVQTYAPGDDLPSVLEKMQLIPAGGLKQKMFKKLYASLVHVAFVWVWNLFFGNGFFHADLHIGNFRVPKIEDIRENVRTGSRDPLEVWLLDFGSCGKLSKKSRCDILDSVYTTLRFDSKIRDMIHDGKYSKTQTDDTMGALRSYDEGRAVPPGFEKIAKVHEHNKTIVKEFIQRLWTVCIVEERHKTPEALKLLAAKMLNYYQSPRCLEFGQLFMKLVMSGTDIGECTRNEVLMFGRGIAYLGGTVDKFADICNVGGADDCKDWGLKNVFEHKILTSLDKIIKFIAKKQILCNR